MAVNANYVNNASVAVLDINISSSDTSVTVTNFSGWPVSVPYWAEIGRDTSSAEVVKVTAVAGSTLTIARGQDGTTASSHNIGDNFEHVIPAQLPNLVETHVDSPAAHGATSQVVGISDVQSLTDKEYRGAHVHSYGDTNPASPAAGYQVLANTAAARDAFLVNNTAADANKRAYALDQTGTPRFEVFNDGTVKIAPVGAIRDALDVDGNTDVFGDLDVGGALDVAGVIHANATLNTWADINNPTANPVTVSDAQGLTVDNKLTAGTFTNEGVSHRPFGWNYINSGVSSSGDFVMDLTGGGAFPAGTFSMMRIHLRGSYSSGNAFVLARVNSDTTANLHNYGYVSYQLSTGTVNRNNANTSNRWALGYWGGLGGDTLEIKLHKTNISSECSYQSVSNRSGSSGFAGNREIMHGHGTLDSNRLINSLAIIGDGLVLGNVSWWAEGFRVP